MNMIIKKAITKSRFLLLVFFSLLCLQSTYSGDILAAQTSSDSSSSSDISSDEDSQMSYYDTRPHFQEYMDGENIGIISGSLQTSTATDNFPTSKLMEFNATSDMISALRAGKIKGFIVNRYAGKEIMDLNNDLYLSPYKLTDIDSAYALKLGNTKLQQEIN